MSVNVVVLRRETGSVEVERWNNTDQTPTFYWDTNYPITNTYITTVTDETSWRKSSSYVGLTRIYTLPPTVRVYLDGSPTAVYANFLLETGYVATAAKDTASDDISVSVRISSDPASAEKSIYLTGETGYYHSSVIEGGKYRFVGWYNGATLISTDAIISRTITADETLTATYEQYKWSLTTVGSLYGTAYIGASPSTLTTNVYEPGTTVSIRATSTNELYKFSKWTIADTDYSTSPTISVDTLDEDSTYTAVFIPISYTLNVTSQNSNQGTVAVKLGGSLQLTQTGLTVSSGISYTDPVTQPTGVEIIATPLFGYSFTGWYLAGSLESSLATYSFSMPEANVSIEARFSVLSTAPLTVTKTKGNPSDTADAKDQGIVSLYHLESVLDLTSAAGTATLVASLYTTLQYKLVPTPASALYQFDGWYQTIEAVEVPITTSGIFVVDGNNLYVTAPNTTAIAVNAQFRKRTVCTIDAVASDSSTYVDPNPAETAGCTCTITNPAPDETGPDGWLSGQTITMEAVQAVGWELRQWLVKLSVSPYTVLVSKSKGDAGFGQTYTFNLTVNCQVIARSVYTLPADQMQIQALHKTGQDVASGTLEIHPCGDNYIEMTNGVMAQVDVDSVCELTAIPANGYKFVNWRITTISGTIVSTVPVYRFTVTASAIYYAEFVATSESSLLLFEGSDIAMLASWRGRINISNMPSNFSCARVYADGYPVAIDVGAAESPSSPLTALRVVRSITNGQSPIRLPLRRPEKYSMIGFEANTTVNAISVATSMEGLKNG